MYSKKMRLMAIVFAMALVMGLSLSACSGGGSGSGGDVSSGGSSNIWEGVSYKIDMQTHLSSTEQLNSSYAPMIALIDEMTGGAVKITAYEANSLYSIPDCLDAVSKGDLIMCEAAEGAWYDNLPVTLIGAGLPFVYSSNEQAYMFMVNRGFVDILNEAYAEYNIHMIPFEYYTSSIISKKPITSAADMRSMKLRASGSLALYENLVGTAVVSVSGSELYSALSTGIVDGTSWGAAQAMYQMNLQEVTSYYMDPDPVSGQWNNIYVNLDWWNSLTKDQQYIIEMAIQLAGHGRSIATDANNVTAKEVFTTKHGITIQTLSSEAISEFSTYGIQLLESFGQNDDYSARAVAALKDFLAEYDGGKMVYNDKISLNK